MTRIRVLHLISGVAIGDQSGGAELHAIQAVRCFKKTDFESLIYAMWAFRSQQEVEWLDRLKSEGLAIAGLTNWTGALAKDFSSVFRNLWSIVGDFKPQIIHSHSERSDALNALVHSLHPLHPKAVRTVHLDQQWKTRPLLGASLNKGFFPFVFDREIAVSRAIFEQLEKAQFRKKEKVALCYNGIDGAVFDRKAPDTAVSLPEGIPEERPRLGIIGRLTEQKGHDILLESIHMVNQLHPVQLLIIGDGPLAESLKAQAVHLGLADSVSFLGIRNDIWDILARLDLFLLPSRWEGFPTVLLEAMSQGVPVITTDIPGSRELVKTGKTGVLVPCNDATALGEAIVAILEDPDRARAMAIEAKDFASQFTIENTAACYADIYRQIATPKI